MNLKVMLFGSRPTECEKRKAAMALNLCATSISRIIASNDMEVLDVEYNAILNNLNLQNMIKDEALLSTFKSILDTITFYRLQAGDKRRAEARYRQKMNNAIWNATSQGAFFLFASAANPTPWAAVSGAIMAIGAFCNVKKAKAEAGVAHDDETWQLERSLIEQLHALRYSLFETSWRLSDRYDFDDSWRLTIPQIEQYNKMLEEADRAWRYFSLAQYRDRFEAYPHYWNELGESAFLAALATNDEAMKRDFTVKAKEAFSKFADIDMGLLREDMIGAAALLRLVQIEYIETRSWSAALDSVANRIGLPLATRIRTLSCSAPDLLTQCAICYAAAYSETKRKEHLDSAVSLMELVVCQKYNMPMSSRLLSKLYLMDSGFNLQYAGLRARVGADGVVPEDDAEGVSLVKADCAMAAEQLENVLVRQFNFALNSATKGLFAGDCMIVDVNLDKFLGLESNDVRNSDSSVVDMLHGLWEDVKCKLNVQFNAISAKLGIPQDMLGIVARDLDANVENRICSYSGDWSNKTSPKDRCIQQREHIKKMFAAARRIYVEKLCKDVLDYYGIQKGNGEFKVRCHEDVESITMGVKSIERELAVAEQREGIAAHDCDSRKIDVFMHPLSDGDSDTTKTWVEYMADPSWVKRMVSGRKNFCVNVDSVLDVIEASRKIESDLEREGKKVRLFTQGNYVAFLNLYSAVAWVGHRLVTMNPDYEVIRYPKSVEVKYMHDDRG